MKGTKVKSRSGSRSDVPWRVAAVGHGHVSHAKLVKHAQIAQAAVNGMAALQSDETADFAVVERILDTCHND